MISRRKTEQHGAALIAMLAVLVTGASWYLLNAANAPANRTALDRARNAQLLQEAKAALIGYAAHLAADPTENNPGRLPCPQNWGDIGTALEGRGAASCVPAAGPAIGWLPWRQLGLPKLLDTHGEQLWYVLSPGWALPTSGANLSINSNTTGGLSVDAQADVVAVIIAPGRPLTTQACGGAAARSQTRGTMPPDHRNYLECQNALNPIGAGLAASGPTDFFNDQVLAITAAELLPAIEAAIASRFERQVAPLLRSAYSNSDGTNTAWPAAPRLPFAAGFAPINYKGAAANTQGLLPFTYSTDPVTGAACAVADPRCDSAFVAWKTTPPAPTITVPNMISSNCTATAAQITCNFRASSGVGTTTVPFTLNGAVANNAGMALRQFDTTVTMAGVNAAGRSASGALNANGSATITLNGNADVTGSNLILDLLCGLFGFLGIISDCHDNTITVPIALLADHALIKDNQAANPQHWFLRNKWHEVSYYAVAPGIAPSGAGACTSFVDCLQVQYHSSDGKQRGLLAIAGRSLAGQARPPAGVTDLLEFPNADGNISFALREPTLMINRTFNDRIAVIGSNP